MSLLLVLIQLHKGFYWDLITDLNDSGRTIILCSHDMHEVDMLCDNVGIINTGNLVAYDSPQGLKDSLLKIEKEEYENNIVSALNEINVNEENEIKYRKMSFILNNSSEKILKAIEENEHVHEMDVSDNGRITLAIDNFNDNAVNSVIKTISHNEGVITSISTEEPSLEDVFIRTTSEVDEDARA